MYYYFYKITNIINNKFYYGVHKTNNIDDGYMGSGVLLHQAYKKYGIENFTKEILKYFDNMQDMFNYEAEIVNEEMILNKNCYNVQLGGQFFSTKGYIPCINVENSNIHAWLRKDDPRYNVIFIPTFKNKHHTEEIKNQIRKIMTPANSTNDRVWVNKDGIVKYLRKDLLIEYLNEGWSLGRKNYKPRKNMRGKSVDKSKDLRYK